MRGVCALWLLALTSACSCDDPTLGEASSKLRTSTPRLDLGRVFVGTTGTGGFALRAVGDASLRYRARYEGDQGPGWQVSPASGFLAANDVVGIEVAFAPLLAGPSRALVVFESLGTAPSTVAVELVAVALDPPDCEDGNGCTRDYFDLATGRCVHEVARLACDDFNACTGNDTCAEGICLGESRSCDDNDVCTDDLCDPRTGCLNVPTVSCDDGNPCTADRCDPNGGCSSSVVDDGTPCDDFEQCTMADICILGECRGVSLPEGTQCDDQDPCSFLDQCVMGECKDPTYEPPGVGDLKFLVELPTGAGATYNPLVDRNSSVFFGTPNGVAAIDRCGERTWTATIGPTLFSGAVSLPGVLSVPVEGRLFELDTETGAEIRRVDLAPLFQIPGSTTSTQGVRLLDLAVRASGGLVASLWAPEPAPGRGLIAELDPSHVLATPLQPLGPRHARRLAIDADEAVVALVREGGPNDAQGREQLVRLGLAGLPETTWSSSQRSGLRTDLALGAQGEVIWTSGLYVIDRTGTPRALLPAPLDPRWISTGAPVVYQGRIYLVYRQATPESGLWATAGYADHLLAVTASTAEIVYDQELPAPAERASPTVDGFGRVYLLSGRGTLLAFQPNGQLYFELEVPRIGPSDGVALTLTPDRVVVGVTEETVFGVQSEGNLGSSSWPRHRRDNFGTGHR